jgi:nucleotide-binding universal stress UspA family protein
MKTPSDTPLLRIERILVPCDFSPPAERALVYALRFAEQFGAVLTVVHVTEPVTHAPAHCSVPDFMNWLETSQTDLKARLQALVDRLSSDIAQELHPKVEVLTATGEAGAEIVRSAAKVQADLIIIATHGYTGIKRFMVGGTTRKVVTHATCPVLVVREQEHEFVAFPDRIAALEPA